MLLCFRSIRNVYSLNATLYGRCRYNKSCIAMERSSSEDLLRGAYDAGVTAVLPQVLVAQHVKRTGDMLCYGNLTHKLDKNVYLVGFGKAVINMVKPIEDILRIDDKTSHLNRGIISVPVGMKGDNLDTKLRIIEGAAHNIPDEAAHNAAQEIVQLIKELSPQDMLLVLISGGGSALLPMPRAPLSLSEKVALVRQLGNAGANIVELNTVRKAVSDVKGGKLATKTKAKIVTLILSDVINSPLDIIASGPTVRNRDDPSMALEILRKYDIEISETMQHVLCNQERESDDSFSHVVNNIIGDNTVALNASCSFINNKEDTSTSALIVTSSLCGNAKQVGRCMAELSKIIIEGYTNGRITSIPSCVLRSLCVDDEDRLVEAIDRAVRDRQPVCLLFGGETTVKVTGRGSGGRNQEMVLAAVIHMEECMDSAGGAVTFLSAGTDGIDGPTPAAGAVVSWSDGRTLVREAMAAGIYASRHLADNDSYTFFSKLKQSTPLLLPGHTGTNVMDLQFLHCQP